MLVLTRKLKESIRIGDAITITVLRVKGNTVRIGIEAPREVPVVRGELVPLVSVAGNQGDEGETLEPVLEDAEEGSGEEGSAGTAPPSRLVAVW